MRQEDTRPLLGILLMLIMGVMATTINAIARYVSAEYGLHPFQLFFFYCAIGWVLTVPFRLAFRAECQVTQWRWQWIRAPLEIAGFGTLFFILQLVPFPIVTALIFMAPIFTTLWAKLLLKEDVGRPAILALVLGMIGTLVIAQPGTADFEPLSLLALIPALCFSLAGMIIRKQNLAGTHPTQIAHGMLMLTSLCLLPLAAYYWQPVPKEAWPLLGLMGLLAAAAQLLVSAAFRLARASTVVPFQFINLLYSSLIAWLMFGEVIRSNTVLGAGVILSGSLYMLLHTRRNARRLMRTVPGVAE